MSCPLSFPFFFFLACLWCLRQLFFPSPSPAPLPWLLCVGSPALVAPCDRSGAWASLTYQVTCGGLWPGACALLERLPHGPGQLSSPVTPCAFFDGRVVAAPRCGLLRSLV